MRRAKTNNGAREREALVTKMRRAVIDELMRRVGATAEEEVFDDMDLHVVRGAITDLAVSLLAILPENCFNPRETVREVHSEMLKWVKELEKTSTGTVKYRS
jgi:hypothetical protein